MTAHAISWAPLVPWVLIAGLALAAVLLSAFALFVRAKGAPLRILALAVLLRSATRPSPASPPRSKRSTTPNCT